MDETATGSATSFGPVRRPQTTTPGSICATVHLRPPSIDHGVASFLWAFGLGLFICLGLVAVGVSPATAVILAGVSAGAIFLYVRVFGEEEPRRPKRRRDRAS